MALQARDSVPPFAVTDIARQRVDYHAQVWQRRNLVLVALGDSTSSSDSYARQLAARPELADDDVRLVVTSDRIPGIDPCALVVADRWGEIHYVQRSSDVAGLPPAGDVVEWLRFVQHQCPECQGEAR